MSFAALSSVVFAPVPRIAWASSRTIVDSGVSRRLRIPSVADTIVAFAFFIFSIYVALA